MLEVIIECVLRSILVKELALVNSSIVVYVGVRVLTKAEELQQTVLKYSENVEKVGYASGDVESNGKIPQIGSNQTRICRVAYCLLLNLSSNYSFI